GNPAGSSPPPAIAAREASVGIVNPAGTGTPNRVISAKPTPLPPATLPPPRQADACAAEQLPAAVDRLGEVVDEPPHGAGRLPRTAPPARAELGHPGDRPEAKPER